MVSFLRRNWRVMPYRFGLLAYGRIRSSSLSIHKAIYLLSFANALRSILCRSFFIPLIWVLITILAFLCLIVIIFHFWEGSCCRLILLSSFTGRCCISTFLRISQVEYFGKNLKIMIAFTRFFWFHRLVEDRLRWSHCFSGILLAISHSMDSSVCIPNWDDVKTITYHCKERWDLMVLDPPLWVECYDIADRPPPSTG